MTRHFQREVGQLKERIVTLCAIVEKNLDAATRSVNEWDADLAKQTMGADLDIDEMEVDIEEECLKVLALYQPVAIDLRLIVATLKINNDLERIGDLAVNIAERAAYLATQPRPATAFDFTRMAEAATGMLRQSVDALVQMDVDMAYAVCSQDDEVDEMNRDMYHLVHEKITAGSEEINTMIHLLSISRHLERVADHATNIAEDVIYMISGSIVRHKVENFTLNHAGGE